MEKPARGALQRRRISPVARAQYHRRKQRCLRRSVGAQLLLLQEPTSSGSAVLDSVGSQSVHVLWNRMALVRRHGAQTVDIFLTGINASWPLIRFLMDDPVYRVTYRAGVEDLLATVFEPSRVSAIFRVEQARNATYVIGSEREEPGRTFAGTPEQFDATVYGPTGLIAYVMNRTAAVRRALGGAQ